MSDKTTAPRFPARRELWAITGLYAIGEPHTFFYTGTWLSRGSAIKEHSADKGVKWGTCYRRGDRAVRVEVREIGDQNGH